MDLMNYVYSNDLLENKEDLIIKIIDLLEEESHNLFSGVVDLDEKSYYDFESLFYKTIALSATYSEVKEAYETIRSIERSRYSGINSRYFFKLFLTCFASVTAFRVDPVLGLCSFILLSSKSGSDFNSEKNYLDEEVKRFKSDKIRTIEITLNNCIRILNDKNRKMTNICVSLSDNPNSDDFSTLISSFIINSYIKGNVDNESIKEIDDNLKLYIVEILRNNLGSDSNNIFELLELAKEKNNNILKLTMKN